MHKENSETGIHMKVALKDIYPNPFRHIEQYPLRRDKIDELKRSYEETTFWENVVARPREGGGVEIAYGHHRIAALREMYPPDHKVAMIIRKELTDDYMLKMMANENMDTWGGDAEVIIQTVRTVIQAYADDQIELPKLDLESVSINVNKANVRFAPFFKTGTLLGPSGDEPRGKPYMASTLAKFLGWETKHGDPNKRVRMALDALQAIEQGTADIHEFENLSVSAALTLAKRKLLSITLPSSNGAKTKAGTELVKPNVPDINTFARLLTIKLDAILDEELDRTRVESLDALLLYKDHLDTHVRADLAKTLNNMAVRAKDYADQLEEDFPIDYQPPLVAIAERLDNGSGPHS
jgi:hypothetical protein